MPSLVERFKNSLPGRSDVLSDKTQRLAFTLGAPAAFTFEEAEEIMDKQEKFDINLDHKNFQFLDDVVKNHSTIRRKLRKVGTPMEWNLALEARYGPLFRDEGVGECNEVDSP
jgi:hypothetical protein